MGQPKKRGISGAATNYVSRKKAMRKLQLSLKDFRRICILKGIYPHEPNNMRKLKGHSSLKTYYYLKDIQFLLHEPLIHKFRQMKIFMKNLTKLQNKKDIDAVDRLYEKKPVYSLDHIVKERYPSFLDAVRDLDDTLCMCFLFSSFPKTKSTPTSVIELCRLLSVEFLHYIIEAKALRKVFISIKGFYYQAEVLGQMVTWVVPHQLGYKNPAEVDFQIMKTFTEFYTTMLGFVNYKLYSMLNLHYPPKVTDVLTQNSEEYAAASELMTERVAALNQSLNRIILPLDEEKEADELPVIDDAEKLQEMRLANQRLEKLKKLFVGLKFFIGREVPREQLVFIVRCFGGEVSWDKTTFIGATFSEDHPNITHQIVDRPTVLQTFTSRYYIQPQWVFDCVNNCRLLPVEDYFPGCDLPAHLSPFVEEEEGDYVPPEREALLASKQEQPLGNADLARRLDGDQEEDSEESEVDEETDAVVPANASGKRLAKRRKMKPKDAVVGGKIQPENPKRKLDEAAEENKLAVMMIPKKKRRLYDKMIFTKKRKIRQVNQLKAKRQQFDEQRKNTAV